MENKSFKANYAAKPAQTVSQKPTAIKAVGGNEEKKKSETTHYAYTLLRDAEGQLLKGDDGKAVKEFVNNLVIYENETQFGSSLKVKVLGPIPTGDIYIQKKRSK